MRRRPLIRMFWAGVFVFVSGVVWGQDYPSKPIRIIAGGAGGASDFTARLIAQGISGPLGQSVTIDNRGGNQQLLLLSAAPDGYTLLIAGNSLWIAPLLRKMPYDAVQDYSPISMASRTPNLLVVHPSVPAKSVRELIALAKARPGELNDSTGGVGGSGHLAGELFKTLANINIVAVPYASSSQEVAELVAGQVQLSLGASPAQVMGQVKLGKLRALAVTTTGASPLAPGLPTVAATVPGYEAETSYGIFAPAKTSASVIHRLNLEIVRALTTTQSKERMFSNGFEVVGNSSEQYAGTIKSEIAKWSKVIKEGGIKVE